MLKKPKLPPAKWREWASQLLHLESLAEAARYMEPGGHEQSEVLRKLAREAGAIRSAFQRQMEQNT